MRKIRWYCRTPSKGTHSRSKMSSFPAFLSKYVGEQSNDSDEEKPGVTTPEPGALHPSQSVITNAHPTPEPSVYHRTRKKAIPAQEPQSSQHSKKGIPLQRLIESFSAQVKQHPIFLNVIIMDDGTPWSNEKL